MKGYEPTDEEERQANAVILKAVAACRRVIERAVRQAPVAARGVDGNLIIDPIIDRLTAEVLDRDDVVRQDDKPLQLTIALEVEAFMALGEAAHDELVSHHYRTGRIMRGVTYEGGPL